MVKRIQLYLKMGKKILNKESVNNEDFAKEYDEAANSYGRWTNLMGKHTKDLVDSKYINKRSMKILDFACGTGYISSLLIKENPNHQITAVDISKGMIRQAKENLVGFNVRFICKDGIEFLEECQEQYDAIFFGWALSYFKHKKLLEEFRRILKPGGIVGVITNIQGTLPNMDEVFFRVMEKHPKEIQKVMESRFNLPKGAKGLTRWMKDGGFKPLKIKQGEEVVSYSRAGELYSWLRETGALAGTGAIFKKSSQLEQEIVLNLNKELQCENRYGTVHKFAYGIFKKGD